MTGLEFRPTQVSLSRDRLMASQTLAAGSRIHLVNDLVATVDQLPAEQGYQGVYFAHRALTGETLPTELMIETKIITAANCCQ